MWPRPLKRHHAFAWASSESDVAEAVLQVCNSKESDWPDPSYQISPFEQFGEPRNRGGVRFGDPDLGEIFSPD